LIYKVYFTSHKSKAHSLQTSGPAQPNSIHHEDTTMNATMPVVALPLVSKIFAGPNETSSQILYWDGFNAFSEGMQLEDMPTARQAEGWWFANKCEGEAEVYSIEDDHEWIRTGC
jgi:hypothetical protein